MADIELLITNEDVETIFKKLKEKGVGDQCPMCSSQNFSIANGFMAPGMFGNLEDVHMFERSQVFPLVAIICKNCGFTSTHSLSVLGLIHLFNKPREGKK